MKCCCVGMNKVALIGGIIAAACAGVAIVSASADARPNQASRQEAKTVQPSDPGHATKPTKGVPRINTLTEQEKKDGWILLFDGASLEHFKGFKSDAVPSSWTIADNQTLMVQGGGGDIMTREQYEDFEFSCEWMVSEGGNSGIIYRVSESGNATYETGPEFQVLDNARHRDNADPRTMSASLYGLYAPTKDMTRPAGEWNTARIVVKGTLVEHWWNGEKVVEADLGSEEFKKLVKASKFDAWKGFAVQPRGHIALQDHGDKVWYRNIKVRVIK